MERHKEYSDSPVRGVVDRKTRLADLAEQIAAGEYHVPAEWIAEAILCWPGRSGRRA